MPITRRMLSDNDLDLLRRVARAGRLPVAATASPWGQSSLDRLLERELVEEVGRDASTVSVRIVEAGLRELAL